MKNREIWLINLEPTIGAEIKKTRPAIIVSHNEIVILKHFIKLFNSPLFFKASVQYGTVAIMLSGYWDSWIKAGLLF